MRRAVAPQPHFLSRDDDEAGVLVFGGQLTGNRDFLWQRVRRGMLWQWV